MNIQIRCCVSLIFFTLTLLSVCISSVVSSLWLVYQGFLFELGQRVEFGCVREMYMEM